MYSAIDRFLFGLFFGMGFAVAAAVLAFIVSLLQGGVRRSMLDFGLSLIG